MPKKASRNSKKAETPLETGVDRKLENANNFRKLLDKKIKKPKANGSEGEKLELYLDNVVPDWRKMTDDRLYKHLQRMLENAEEIRRFEIELIWKRSVYIVSVIFALYGAFFYLFSNFFASPDERYYYFVVLFPLAMFNQHLTKAWKDINIEAQAWHKNWQYHVEYLQALLGLHQMVIALRQPSLYSIGGKNIFISVMMHSAAKVVTIGSYLALLSQPYKHFFDSIITRLKEKFVPTDNNLDIIESMLYVVIAVLIIAFLFRIINRDKPKDDKSEKVISTVNVQERMLRKFNFKELQKLKEKREKS